jgi:RHS repeat-associated protein
MYPHVLTGDQLYYYISDHLGSARCVVDSVGGDKAWYDYLPYGPLRDSWISTGATDMRYTGKEYDEEEGINQYYFGARFLHETMLRFTSVDPLTEKYPGLSPYVYAAANPVRNYDPDGEEYVVVNRNDFGKSINRMAKERFGIPNWIVDIMISPHS